ncbi:type III pantothenate kinase [Guggenheimella bovis]
MILTIDVGNSNIVSVLYDEDGTRLIDRRVTTVREADREVYERFFDDHKELTEVATHITISCVVPRLRDLLKDLTNDLFPEKEIYFVSYENVSDFDVRITDPETLGSDLIATSFGAFFHYPLPAIIADLGSATKLTVVDEGNIYYGGALIPGIYFTAQSIHAAIPQLPMIDLKKPERLIGTDTMECMQIGIVTGTLMSVLKMADGFEKELGKKCSRVMTGGLSKLFQEKDLESFVYDEFLLNDGLYYLTKKKRERE